MILITNVNDIIYVSVNCESNNIKNNNNDQKQQQSDFHIDNTAGREKWT